MSTTVCGAEAWRTFAYEGLLIDRAFRSAHTRCTLPQGHAGKHKGWLGFRTGRGLVNAIVEW